MPQRSAALFAAHLPGRQRGEHRLPGEVTIRNGATALTGWTFPNSQTFSQLWNGSHAQTGPNVTVRNAAWNGALPPGGTATVGLTGTRTGANGVPATVSCARG